MPNRHYVPSGGRWPHWLDHSLAHINEVGIGLIALATGLLLTADLLHPQLVTYSPGTLDGLGPPYVYLLCFFLVTGPLVSIVATLADFPTRTVYWAVLRLGLLLEALGWFIYGGSLHLLLHGEAPLIPQVVTLGLGLLRISRFLRSMLDEKRIREAEMRRRLL